MHCCRGVLRFKTWHSDCASGTLQRRPRKPRPNAWLARLGLKGFGGRFPHELSGGQRKRVAIAQILALKPKLLLMDEPFASLDAIVRTRITQELLNWVEREHLSVLLVTHDLEEALTVSDTVYLLSQGPSARVVASYNVAIPRPRDIFASRKHAEFCAAARTAVERYVRRDEWRRV